MADLGLIWTWISVMEGEGAARFAPFESESEHATRLCWCPPFPAAWLVPSFLYHSDTYKDARGMQPLVQCGVKTVRVGKLYRAGGLLCCYCCLPQAGCDMQLACERGLIVCFHMFVDFPLSRSRPLGPGQLKGIVL
ncbi:hypothetical protein N658DRAFT_93352 [Parathielavia hyrcaniae]|uniref:Uncharacterized protein n=1 Tax=Parathielavia hyrcaniae TaxID=113614 RepID=A0AAN6PZ91_9PEZI|nr:hypothetical protein N658DRAFT_93352 [Parathielavia hyrcaniae]